MFKIEKCAIQSWNLSSNEESVAISQDKMKLLDHHDILAIQFLYQNYKKNYKGAILNEQCGLNMHMQVSIFLHTMYKYVEKNFQVLIISPNMSVNKWKNYLTMTGLKTIVVNSNTCSTDFDDQHGVALLLPFDKISLVQYLCDYKLFSIIVECFDEMPKKNLTKTITGDFHIGLTTRNFYVNPDQKLQWMMLNWCSPGCCGEQKDFCRIDNDNFANFRDNYRHWWFRLSSHFCDSLKDKLIEEKVMDITYSESKGKKRKNVTRKSRKTKHLKEIEDNMEQEKIEEDRILKCESKNEFYSKSIDESDFYSSNYNFEESKCALNENLCHHQLQVDVNNPNCTFSKSDTDHIDSQHTSESTNMEAGYELSLIKSETKDETSSDILLSLINNETGKEQNFSHKEELLVKKDELSSQIFSEFPSNTCISPEEDASSDFFKSLIN